MKSYQYAGPAFTAPRSHPWDGAVDDPSARHLDLVAEPALIRTALEDFVPWQHEPAIARFFDLVAWINGPTSPLISNDCAFTGPHRDHGMAVAAPVLCTGRVMVLFRDLAQNLDDARLADLTERLHRRLAARDQVFAGGAIGTTRIPVHYRTLPGPAEAQRGAQLMLSFWAWGPRDDAALAHLGRVLVNLDRALREACAGLDAPSA
ncbi:MAG: hypothetical protein IPL61_05180 [Myxococcales bacterium]|nr:hypothetical protein [Myxococcales bacterium]